MTDELSKRETQLLPGGVSVEGKPLTELWATPGLRWQGALISKIDGPLAHPRLRFTRTDRSWYDLDNLVYPVVSVLGCEECEPIWAEVRRDEPEGVLITDQAPPPPPSNDVRSFYLARPSSSSVRERPRPIELSDALPFGEDELLGMSLMFDSENVRVGELSFEGPVKSLVDDLGPLFGMQLISGRLLAKDYRVRELRISRGHAPSKIGVTVVLWFL